MEAKMLPMITAADLEDEIFIQYNVIVDVASLLFVNYSINCYRMYEFKTAKEHLKDATNFPEDYSEAELEDIRLENLVANYLIDVFPQYDSILIYISW